jgi:Proteins of 100 residues with WXG
VPNVNVSYAEMQTAARQLQAGEQTISGDLARLKRLVDQLVAGGYVTDTSSKQFPAGLAGPGRRRHASTTGHVPARAAGHG